MSVLGASEKSSFRPTLRDLSTDPGPVPLPQPDDLKAILDAEIATHATILTIIGDCERQIDESSASLSPQDPTIRDLRHTLSHALLEASQSRTRQVTLGKQLHVVSRHQRRLEENTSGLGLAIERFFEARDESLRMEFAASAQVFGNVADGARMVVRQVVSLYEGMIGQGARIGRAWSEVWQQLRADLSEEEKEEEGNLEEREGEEEKAEEEKEDEE